MRTVEVCRACGGDAAFSFDGTLIGRSVAYFQCGRCEYLQTEQPTWLDAAYASPINISDTGIVARNVLNTRRVGSFCLMLGKRAARIVDFAGGHGIQVRMLRDAGFDARWADKFCENLFARGFEHAEGQGADLITAFEAFEHFVEPRAELARMLAIAPTVLFSTQLLPAPTPPAGSWWYYGSEHGQHIGLYRRKSLEVLADSVQAKLYTDGDNLHVITREAVAIDFRRLRLVMRLWPIAKRTHGLRPLTHDDHAAMAREQMAKAKSSASRP